MERVGSLARTGKVKAHPVLVECVEDRHATRLEGETDVDVSLSDVPARPFEQFGPLEWQPPQSLQLGKRLAAPLQVEASPPDWTGGVDHVPGQGEIAQLLMVDLDLLAIEVEQHRAIAEPLVIPEVPDHPDPSERPASKTTQTMPMLLHDVATAVQPRWLVARDAEIEHDVILPEPPFFGSKQSRAETNRRLRKQLCRDKTLIYHEN